MTELSYSLDFQTWDNEVQSISTFVATALMLILISRFAVKLFVSFHEVVVRGSINDIRGNVCS